MTVVGVNDPPTIEAETADVALRAGNEATVALSATDPEGGALTFTIVDGPSFASLIDATPTDGAATPGERADSVLTLAPGPDHIGTHTITVAVADDGAPPLTTETTITVGVEATPTAPTRVVEGLVALYDFADGDGDVVSDSTGLAGPLTVADPSAVRWASGSLTVHAPTDHPVIGAGRRHHRRGPSIQRVHGRGLGHPGRIHSGRSSPHRLAVVGDRDAQRHVGPGCARRNERRPMGQSPALDIDLRQRAAGPRRTTRRSGRGTTSPPRGDPIGQRCHHAARRRRGGGDGNGRGRPVELARFVPPGAGQRDDHGSTVDRDISPGRGVCPGTVGERDPNRITGSGPDAGRRPPGDGRHRLRDRSAPPG